MNLNKMTIISDPEKIVTAIQSNRRTCYSLCTFLASERMDWRGLLKIDETLPNFIPSTPEIERNLINIARNYNHKRKWLIEKGCFAEHINSTHMRYFILINETEWISVHRTKLQRMEAMRELVLACSPKVELITKNGYNPGFQWTTMDKGIEHCGEFKQL